MQAPTRRSYGIIPIAFEEGAPVFLILRAYQHWGFPKGQAEPGEAPLEAARREMREETGIADFALSWGEVCMETEPYSGGKVSTFYPARVRRQQITLPVSPELGRPEHDEYRWVSFEEARALLPPRLVRILEWAYALATRERP
jgi:8-oxo-dGTP pyrophosphatase MutT (NUDIX family)